MGNKYFDTKFDRTEMLLYALDYSEQVVGLKSALFYFYDKGDDETVQTVTTIITVPNYIEGDYLLPETGGMGTQYLYITGGSLMFLSVVFLLGKHKSTRKRRSDFSRA